MKKLSQKERVLNYMKSHKRGITAFDGFNKLGITQVHTVIHELRKDGFEIKTNMTKNAKTGTRFSRWTIEENGR